MDLKITKCLFLWLLGFLIITPVISEDYYFHSTKGSDQANGLSPETPFQSLSKLKKLSIQPGDRILLAGGETFSGTLEILGFKGHPESPLMIETYFPKDLLSPTPAKIDAKGFPQGVLLENSSYVTVSNLQITGDGYGSYSPTGEMRVGVLVLNSFEGEVKGITLQQLYISDLFFEEPGFSRGENEVKSANGTQRYGWGIRLINQSAVGMIENIKIFNNHIENVSHTGIKLTGGSNQSIRNITIIGNKVNRIGGPGIQMSEVKFVYVSDNEVTYTGSADDSRKWGRGSGLWTWGSSMVLIEKNKFMYANGPGDSAGAHIDYNCDNIVLQYNLSAYNAGGFAEILGNNYNCAYRYNISINDGYRIKGENGAFQEGKTLWLSGYQGEKRSRKGPVNSYIYNNTIYVNEEIVSKIAIDNRSRGVLIANNIFYMEGGSQLVAGDQYRPDDDSDGKLDQGFLTNNLFLKAGLWPASKLIEDNKSLFGDPQFANPGGINPEDYIPKNKSLVSGGIEIPFLLDDSFGLIEGLNLQKDFLGSPISGKPGIGAILPAANLSDNLVDQQELTFNPSRKTEGDFSIDSVFDPKPKN
jgi:hypothetical protein